MKRTTLLKTLIVATSVFAAGNFMTCTGNYNVMATEVQAAELEMFTGEWSPVQNDIASASAAVIKTGDTIAVAMFKDTMIQLKVAEGVTPVITLGTETAASVVAPTGDGILIAGNQLGEGLIQVQNSVNGAVTNIVVSVLDAGTNGTSTDNTIDVTEPTTQTSGKYFYFKQDTGTKSTESGYLFVSSNRWQLSIYFSQ